MTGVLTRAFPAILLSKRQNITAVTTPVRAHIRKLLETMRNTVIDLLLVRIRLCVGFADTLRDNTAVALSVTSVLAVLALHTCRILEKIAAECTTHDVVELLRNELVAIHLVNLFLPLSNGTFSVQTSIKSLLRFCLLGEADCKMYSSRWLKRKPRIDRLGWNNATTA